MSDTIGICQIPGNSDIAGIGVRASVYAQACLAAFNTLYIFHSVSYIGLDENGDPLPTTNTTDVEMHAAGAAASTANPSPTTEPASPTLADVNAEIPSVPSADGVNSIPIIVPMEESSSLTDAVGTPMGSQPPLHDAPVQLAADLPSPPPKSHWEIRNTLPLFRKSQKEYLSLASALERSMFMIGFAVILSAILEAKSSSGLNPYHALIVLNISQINNWSGFLILSIRGELNNTSTRRWGLAFLTKKSFFTPGFFFYTAHAMMMAGLGLYFWRDLTPFLAYAAAAEVQPCRPVTFFWVFGAVDVTNRTLRVVALVFYAFSMIPIVNVFLVVIMASATLVGFGFPTIFALLLLGIVFFLLSFTILPITVFILVLIWHPISKIHFVQKVTRKIRGPIVGFLNAVVAPFKRVQSPTKLLGLGQFYGPIWGLVFSFAFGLFYSAPIVYFMVSTELIIQVNKPNIEPGTENKWTYGQTLALFSALTAIFLYIYELYFLLRRRARKKVRQSTDA